MRYKDFISLKFDAEATRAVCATCSESDVMTTVDLGVLGALWVAEAQAPLMV